VTALSAYRNTPRLGQGALPDEYYLPVAASTTIYAGGLVMLDAGYAKPAAVGAGKIVIGRADKTVDNSDGSAGDAYVKVFSGIYRWANSASADAIAQAQVGSTAYMYDDATVGKLLESTVPVKTLTPTAANSTVYSLILFAAGRLWFFTTTSDGSATATEICDAFRTAMAADAAFTAVLVASGTATLVLTGVAGSGVGADFDVHSTGAGTIAVANTTPGVKRSSAGTVVKVDSDGVWVLSKL
jgi:hypothetical protein